MKEANPRHPQGGISGATARFARFLACLLLLAACEAKDPAEETIPARLTGIDHLPDHLSVQDFSVNGTGGFQAGGGGSVTCCVSLPRKWHPGLTALVWWNTTNLRDCTWEQRARRVPVEPYDEVGRVWAHFLADGSVRVVSSASARASTSPMMYLCPLVEHPPRTHAYAIGLDSNVLASVEATLKRSRFPTRILWGTGDDIFSKDSPDYLAGVFGDSRGVRRVEGARLFWPEEFPELVAEEARRLWGV